MSDASDLVAPSIISGVQNVLVLMQRQQLVEAGFISAALLPDFRDAPQRPYAIAFLFYQDPQYVAISLDGPMNTDMVLRLRTEIPNYKVREEFLAKHRIFLAGSFKADMSRGTLGNDLLWALSGARVIAQNLPSAFILYSKYADDGGDSVVLYFQRELMPDDVLVHFRSAIQGE